MSMTDLPEWQEQSKTPDLDLSHGLDLLYGVLFHPVSTFNRLADQEGPTAGQLFTGLMTVVVISAIIPVVRTIAVAGKASDLIFAVPFHTVLGVLMWAAMGLIIALLAYAFSGQARVKTFLCLSALATLPWLLAAPAALLKMGIGALGVAFSALLGLGIWLWTVLLFALAIHVTYRMSAERVMIVLVMPFVMLLVFLFWVGGFFSTIRYLSPLG